MFQTHFSADIVAACAGLPYGLSEAIRQLQEVRRPVLLVCGEKFSDKIGTVRTLGMIFGDGAAAMVVGPAPDGAAPDVEYYQTYASGPMSEVDSIVWPNPEFDNNITVFGPEVKALVKRYLTQMIRELSALPNPDGGRLAARRRSTSWCRTRPTRRWSCTTPRRRHPPEQLYFNIERVGNTSSASIPLAIYDAVAEGVIDRPMRLFAPGFGAGAVGGYVGDAARSGDRRR
jgi:3-oxoacyl-[acyl-carrier-protein] synthase III